MDRTIGFCNTSNEYRFLNLETGHFNEHLDISQLCIVIKKTNIFMFKIKMVLILNMAGLVISQST